MYRVKFKRLTGMMERISRIFRLSDFLGRISGRLAARNWSGIYLVIFGILRQNFWAIHVIGIFNHIKTLSHLTPHIGINIFYWLNRYYLSKILSLLEENTSKRSSFKENIVLVSEIRKVKMATVVKGDPKVTFWIATTPRCRGGRKEA